MHFDPEHNFLLQVRGTKEMNVAGFVSTDAGQRELERFYRGGHRNLESVPGEPDVFLLEPGQSSQQRVSLRFLFPLFGPQIRNLPARA